MTNKISSSPLPIVLNHEGNLELAFNSMPFWEGVQKKPGVRKTLPFSLMATNEGPISQSTPEKVITEIVDASNPRNMLLLLLLQALLSGQILWVKLV